MRRSSIKRSGSEIALNQHVILVPSQFCRFHQDLSIIFILLKTETINVSVDTSLYVLQRIVYRYLHSASLCISQTEEQSVGVSSRKKVRLKTRETRRERIEERRREGRRSKEKDQKMQRTWIELSWHEQIYLCIYACTLVGLLNTHTRFHPPLCAFVIH